MNNVSRTKNSARNIAYGFMNKLIMLIISFVSRKIFIHYIGVNYLGINGLFASILGMLSLADLGFGTAMAYSFYKPLAEKNEEKLAALITFYRKVYNIIAIVVAVVGISLIPFLRFIVNTEVGIPNLEVYYFIFLANTVISYFNAYKASIISADQKGYILSSYTIKISLFKVMFQIVLVIFTKNYLLYILTDIVATVINNIILSYKATILYPYIKNRVDLEIEDKKELFKNMKSIFLYKVSGVLLNSTDNILISSIVGTVFIGYYSNYNIVITNVNAFITIIFNSLIASIGNLMVSSEAKKRYEVFSVMQMISFWLSGFCLTCMAFLINDFIQIWLGKEYIMDSLTVIATLLNFYLGITLQPLWSFREATGLYRKTRYIMIFTAIINLVLSVILGIEFGVGGILLASFISRIVTYFWYEPFLLFKDYFNKKVIRYYLYHLSNLVMCIAIIGVVSRIMNFFQSVSIINLFLKFVICMLVSNIVYLLRYARSKELLLILHKIKSLKSNHS